ncbi:MAG: hypothetical protein V3V12_08320 [Gammaproteobacteria bacterium]
MDYMHPIWKKHFYAIMILIGIMFLWGWIFPIGVLFKIYFVILWFYGALFFLGSGFGVGPMSHVDRARRKKVSRAKQPWERNDE